MFLIYLELPRVQNLNRKFRYRYQQIPLKLGYNELAKFINIFYSAHMQIATDCNKLLLILQEMQSIWPS